MPDNVKIEQAAALGWSIDRTARMLKVDPSAVIAVWEKMDIRAGVRIDDPVLVEERLTRKQPRSARKFVLKPHGTMAAARRHERKKERLCNRCLKARREYINEHHGNLAKRNQEEAP